MDSSLGKIWSDYAQLLANRKAREDPISKHTCTPPKKHTPTRPTNLPSPKHSAGIGSIHNVARGRGVLINRSFPLPSPTEKRPVEWADTSSARGCAFLSPRMTSNGNEHSFRQRQNSITNRQERPGRSQRDFSSVSPLQNPSSMQTHNLHPHSKTRRGSSMPWYPNSPNKTTTEETPSAVAHGMRFPRTTTQSSMLSYNNRREPSLRYSHGFPTPESETSYSPIQLKKHLATKKRRYPGPAVFAVPLKSSSLLRNGNKLEPEVSEASMVVLESLALTEIKERENMLKQLEDMQSYRRKFILGALPESPEFVLERSIQTIVDADKKDLESISTELMETDLESDYDESEIETETEEEEYFQLITNRR